MTTAPMEKPAISEYLAQEVRATLGRKGWSKRRLALALGHNTPWLYSRIGPSRTVDITLEEVTQMAEALGVDAEGLIVAALRACRDSNPKPSDP